MNRGRGRLLAEILRPHRGRLVLAAGCVVVSTAAVVAVPYIVKRGIDDGVVPRHLGGLLAALAVFMVVAVVQAAAEWGAERLGGGVAELSLFELRMRLWRHLQRLSLDFHERQGSGQVVSRMTADVEAVSVLLCSTALDLVSNGLMVVGIAVVLVMLDPVLALVVGAVVPPLLWVTWAFKVRSERAYRAVRENIALVIVHLAETLSGVRVVQAFTREGVNQEAFDRVNRQHLDAYSRTVRLSSTYGSGIELLGQLAVFLVLVVGGFRAVNGDVTVGTLTAFMLYVRQFFGPVQELSEFHNSLRAANAALDQIGTVLSAQPTVESPPGSPCLPPGPGAVELSGVVFSYGTGPVLRGVDLTVEGGETLALVGSTGAGKSTLAKLVARFYDPDEGRVAIDGCDLRSVDLASVRREVAMVPQEGFIFGGTIHDNVAFGRPGASRAEVEEAAWAVGAHPFIVTLPDGYDSVVDPGGSRLSAGQRQLISFARVWLVSPRLLVLDEATSALDGPSERLVQRALRQLLADRTAIVISHRLSSIGLADRVAVIEAGRVAEVGTPSRLLASDSRFRRFYQQSNSALC